MQASLKECIPAMRERASSFPSCTWECLFPRSCISFPRGIPGSVRFLRDLCNGRPTVRPTRLAKCNFAGARVPKCNLGTRDGRLEPPRSVRSQAGDWERGRTRAKLHAPPPASLSVLSVLSVLFVPLLARILRSFRNGRFAPIASTRSPMTRTSLRGSCASGTGEGWRWPSGRVG